MTYFEAAVRARATLRDAGLLAATAALDADLLARDAAGWDAVTWLARRREPADDGFLRRLDALLARRAAREPVAYIRGVQEFWGRDFRVTPAVLIPRPETELLVTEALRILGGRAATTIADVGTGTGCLAVTLAAEIPRVTVYAVDLSPEALVVARENAERHEVADRIHFVHGAYLAGVPRPLDLIVSNPPYVAERDRPALSPEVRDHEPAVALFGGGDGWRDIRALLQAAAEALADGGTLLIEFGFGQSDAIGREVSAAGLHLDALRDDLQGIPRVAVITRR